MDCFLACALKILEQVVALGLRVVSSPHFIIVFVVEFPLSFLMFIDIMLDMISKSTYTLYILRKHVSGETFSK